MKSLGHIHKLNGKILVLTAIILGQFFGIAYLLDQQTKLNSENNTLKNSIKQIEEVNDFVSSEQTRSRQRLKDYKRGNESKDMYIDVLLERLKNEDEDNPIDEYFDHHLLADYSTMAMTMHSIIYRNVWKDEFEYTYNQLEKLAHPDYVDYVRQGKENVLQYAYSEGEISVGATCSNALVDKVEPLLYGSLSRVERPSIEAMIYKSQVLKARRYLSFNGHKIDYFFKADAFDKKVGDAFVELEDFSDCYKVSKHQGGYAVDFINKQGDICDRLSSKTDPVFDLISHIFLMVKVNDNDRYIYNMFSDQLSASYEDTLYYNTSYIVHLRNGKLKVTNFSSSWYEDTYIDLGFEDNDQVLDSIREVTIDGDILKVTYQKHHDLLTEYLNLRP